jgi:hypothetical protein
MQEAASLPWANPPAPICELVRSSCATLLENNPHVTIDDAVLKHYARELDATKLQTQRKHYPLVFPTQRSEVNFLCTLAYLQIGSGWRRALHAQRGGKGAAETVTFGCMGMHISGEMSARVLAGLGLFDVAQLFGLKIQEEFELSPGIHSERPTELYSLGEALRKLLNDAGSMLRNLACEDWFDYWNKVNPGTAAQLREIDEATGKPKRASAEQAVARLARHFTGLQDAYILPPRKQQAQSVTAEATKDATAETPVADVTSAASSSSAAAAATPAAASAASSAAAASESPRVVYLMKKAQLIVAELYLRFGVGEGSEDSVFNFAEIERLTVMSDNVLPAVLRAHGVLVYSAPLAARIDANEKLTDREQEATVRAAAVVACERIVQEYNKSHNVVHGTGSSSSGAAASAADAGAPGPALTTLNLDYHLWLSGKNPDLRGLARHATHSIYY